MAHFAQLDQNNVVTQVIVVANKDTEDDQGNEKEEIGIAFCRSLFGVDTNWRQTSYNGNFRFRYAGTGYTYDGVLDAFITPKPFPSWLLNTTTASWEAPVPMPPLTPEQEAEGYFYVWNESTQSWDLTSGLQ